MRGLPPIPSSIALLTQEYENQGRFVSTSWWFQLNLPVPYEPSDLSILLSEYTLFALPNLLGSMGSAVNPSTCRLSVGGLTVIQKNPPASGANAGELALNCAGGLLWRTGDAGRKGWATTYLPGLPDAFVDSNWMLSAEGYGNLQDSGTNFFVNMRSLPSYPPETMVIGTLHRVKNGAPLAASTFSPYISVEPVPKLVTIRRRIPAGRSVSPF